MRIIPQCISAAASDIALGAKKDPKSVIVALAVIAAIVATAATLGLVGVAPLLVTIPVGTMLIGGVSLGLIGHLWRKHHYAGRS
ncbi:MAG: hypothetical protein KDK62_06440 [Chlamydiia bacterium]|nr:hypothetical protein [Chlamydiia bacterium]